MNSRTEPEAVFAMSERVNTVNGDPAGLTPLMLVPVTMTSSIGVDSATPSPVLLRATGAAPAAPPTPSLLNFETGGGASAPLLCNAAGTLCDLFRMDTALPLIQEYVRGVLASS